MIIRSTNKKTKGAGIKSAIPELTGTLLMYFVVALIGVSVPCVYAENYTDQELLDLSLEELMNLEVSVIGTLTVSDAKKVPSSVTTITREQIELTPVRNLMDLIEFYVPGVFWFSQYNGHFMAVRGIALERADKVLLLVNGRLMNTRSMLGAVTELENWDLNDIERVDIIRGPGSVTYGPGAIQGIINIITRNAETSPGTQAGWQYVSRYDSKGVHLSHGATRKNYKSYFYGSWTRTQGVSHPDLYVANFTDTRGPDAEYLGRGSYSNYVPYDYFADAEDKPQIKLHGEIDFLDNWKLWARYTNSGTSRISTWSSAWDVAKSGQSSVGDGRLFHRVTMAQQGIVSLENQHHLNDRTALHTTASLESSSVVRRMVRNWGKWVNQRLLYHPSNDAYNTGESKLIVNSLLRHQTSDRYRWAVGAEYTIEHYGPAWGEDPRTFTMNAGPAIISGTDSYHYSGSSNEFLVGDDGFTTHMMSGVGEFNATFHPKLSLLLSGRIDKHAYTNPMYSPRAALISQWQCGTFKLIGQKSVRMNNTVILYADHQNGKPDLPEELKSVELIYDSTPCHNTTFNMATFYYDMDIIGWNPGVNSTTLLGKHRLWGIELGTKYDTDKFTLGLNHSHVEQDDFSLASGVASSYISYADHSRSFGGFTFTDTGNDINNWPNDSTKLYFIYRPVQKLSILGGARVFWGYPGSEDLIDMYEKGLSTYTGDQAASQAAINKARADDMFGIDFRFDLAMKYQITDHAFIRFFGMNLLKIKNNRRYAFTMNTPTAVDEPTVWGINAVCHH